MLETLVPIICVCSHARGRCRRRPHGGLERGEKNKEKNLQKRKKGRPQKERQATQPQSHLDTCMFPRRPRQVTPNSPSAGTRTGLGPPFAPPGLAEGRRFRAACWHPSYALATREAHHLKTRGNWGPHADPHHRSESRSDPNPTPNPNPNPSPLPLRPMLPSLHLQQIGRASGESE